MPPKSQPKNATPNQPSQQNPAQTEPQKVSRGVWEYLGYTITAQLEPDGSFTKSFDKIVYDWHLKGNPQSVPRGCGYIDHCCEMVEAMNVLYAEKKLLTRSRVKK